MSTVREGDRISNYILEALLGTGSFGEVWRARHHVFADLVAIKIPTDSAFVQNLRREGAAIHGLKHPNIVRAIDMDPFASPPYLVMELVQGASLREAITHWRGTMPIASVVTVLRGVLQALAVAHQSGVIHRDIKPENILLALPADQIGAITEAQTKVTDFGLGQIGGATAQGMMQSGSMHTEHGRSISGTLAYMAPEQRDGAPPTPQGDLYSCGVMLFEMLTGERPQGVELPSSLRLDCPAALDAVFRQCYARADRRYRSAEEMLAALPAFARRPPAPPSMPPGSPPPRPGEWGRGQVARGDGTRRGPDRQCGDCGVAALPDDQFCIGCGRQLVESVPRCTACKAFVHRNDRFCIFCGKDLRVLVE
jgi:serine/threonine-protein kinase